MSKLIQILALLSISALVVQADVAVCAELAPPIFAEVSDTEVGQAFAQIAAGLGSIINDPLSLTGGFDTIFADVPEFAYLCGEENMDNVTELIASFEEAALSDSTCSLLSGGFQLLCAKDSVNNQYCGDLDITAFCDSAPSCCVPTFKIYILAAAEEVPALNAVAGLIDYAAICEDEVIETPPLDQCLWLDGSVVTEEFDWHFNFDCDATALLDFLNGLADSDEFKDWEEEDLEHCIEGILTLTDVNALLYQEADDEASFEHICGECVDVLNAFIEEVNTLAEDDPLCYLVSGLFEVGCQYSGEDYCGDAILAFDEEEGIDCDSVGDIDGCCLFGLFTYVTGTASASDFEEILGSYDITKVCESSVTELTASFATCSLDSALSQSAAFGFSIQSMFAIIAASIALAFLMIA